MKTLLSNWNADATLTAVALAGAAVAFAVGLIQYRKAQRWKRAEWVTQELKALFNDPLVAAALKMVDWSGRRVVLYSSRKEETERSDYVTSEEVLKALRYVKDVREAEFTEKEAAIRDAFDSLFDGLDRIDGYVESGLVKIGDVTPYLDYWAKPLSSEANPVVKSYITGYGFSGTSRLLERVASRAEPERRLTWRLNWRRIGVPCGSTPGR